MPRTIFRLPAIAIVLAVMSTPGCSMFKHKDNPDYKLSQEQRPLEIPPDLNRPATDSAMAIPSGSAGRAVTASQAQAQAQISAAARPLPPSNASPSSFGVAGRLEDVFNQAGDALAGIGGAAVDNKSQLLSTYDVTYNGHNTLIKLETLNGGVRVHAVNARGQSDSSAEAVQLIAAMKAAMVK